LASQPKADQKFKIEFGDQKAKNKTQKPLEPKKKEDDDDF
jgi:hypothetical protein